MNISKMPTLPNKTQTKSPNPSNPPSRTNSIKKPSKPKVVEATNKNLPSNPPSRTNSVKGKPSKLKPTNSIKVNSCELIFEIDRQHKPPWPWGTLPAWDPQQQWDRNGGPKLPQAA